MDMKYFFSNVIEKGERPPLDAACAAGMPPAYKALMQACWAADPAARPTFEIVSEKLKAQLKRLQGPGK